MWTWGKLEIGWGVGALLLVALLAGAGPVLPLAASAAVCHELGHLGTLALVGAEVEQVRLTAFGAEIRADTRYLPYRRELLCVLAGPAVNLALALLLSRRFGAFSLAGANLLLGVFNLLPLPSLDGGRALHLAVSWGWGPGAADRVCRWIGLACGALLLAGAWYLTVRRQAGLFLLFAAMGAFFPQLPLAKRRKTG